MLTASFISSVIAGGKTPSLFDAFPDLFEEEKELQNIAKAREQMLTYASLWNAKRARQEDELNG